MGGSDHFYFLEAVATVVILLTASNNDVKLGEAPAVHFA